MYKTKDQFISSTLYASGLKLAFPEWEDGKCFLYFKDKKKCDEIVAKYYTGELSLDPRVLFDSFKTVKSIIYKN